MTGVALVHGADLIAVITRDPARELARRELSKPEYHQDDPSLIQRAASWVFGRITDLANGTSGLTPGGTLGVVIVVALIALGVFLVVRRVGGVRRSAAAGSAPLLGGTLRSAEEHRAEADAAAASGRYDLAVRERLRAIARELETRALLDPRPGRTADELANEAGVALPEFAGDLRLAARTFDDVWYGGRPATAESYAVVRAADLRVRDARASLGARR